MSPASEERAGRGRGRLGGLQQPSWVVIRSGHRLRWGGERRRLLLFARLAERTRARVIDGYDTRSLQRGVEQRGIATSMLRRVQRRPRIASSETLPVSVLRAAVALGRPAAVALYDDAALQASALGLPFQPDHAARHQEQRNANIAEFALQVVPTESFAEFVGLDRSRVIVAGNGTDTRHIQPLPWPARAAIGYASGAAPGRGIEELVAAARLIRSSVPELELLLWLVATGEISRQYLAALQGSLAAEPWIRIETVAYADLSEALGKASVMCIPHPRSEYMDIALPVKLLDMMAAGRPVVVTPRRETEAIVRAVGCGLVAAGDTPEDLAEAMLRLIEDQRLAHELASAGRAAAVTPYDWTVVGDRVADEVLRRHP
jgi:glycosyltransferase involved in cell wall biosynthesis